MQKIAVTATGLSAIIGGAAAQQEDTNSISGGDGMTVTPSSAETESDPKAVRDRIVEKMGEQVLQKTTDPHFRFPHQKGL
jgi:hypothetical protein